MDKHNCTDLPSGWVDITYDEREKEWDLRIDCDQSTSIKYCPFCGCELKPL